MSLPVIPTIDELTNRVVTLLQQALVEAQTTGADLSVSDLAVARSNLKAQAFIQGAGIHGAYRYIRDFVAKQAIPTKSVDEYLDEWMAAYGIPRKEATFPGGSVSGNSTGAAVLPAGSVLQHASGLAYLVQADTGSAGGAVTVKVTCTTAGRAGNLAAGEKLALQASDTGFDAEFVVEAAGLVGGFERESDAEGVYRLKQRMANPPRGSAPSDYARWALQVPGITRAWGVRNPSGPTTAGVIIMADGNVHGLPTEAQRQAVYDYIRHDDRGPPDELFVFIPSAKFIDMVLAIDPDTPVVRSAIELELKDLFFREAKPGGRIPISQLIEAVSIAPGEYTHKLIEPEPISGGFIFSTAYEVLVLRGVEFEEMA